MDQKCSKANDCLILTLLNNVQNFLSEKVRAVLLIDYICTKSILRNSGKVPEDRGEHIKSSLVVFSYRKNKLYQNYHNQYLN